VKTFPVCIVQRARQLAKILISNNPVFVVPAPFLVNTDLTRDCLPVISAVTALLSNTWFCLQSDFVLKSFISAAYNLIAKGYTISPVVSML
jgi:hypothetical protein